MFQRKGFAIVGGELRLADVAFSRNTTFGASDVHELAAILDEGTEAAMQLPATQALIAALLRPAGRYLKFCNLGGPILSLAVVTMPSIQKSQGFFLGLCLVLEVRE